MKLGCIDSGFIMREDTLVGIDLGWDHTAEHEMGIHGIRTQFGMQDGLSAASRSGLLQRVAILMPAFARFFGGENPYGFGLARRIINRVPDHLRFFAVVQREKRRQVTGCALVLDRYASGDAARLPYGLYFPSADDPKGMVTAWDGDSFGIVVREEHNAKLVELHEAFARLDIAIFQGASGVFYNGGLRIVIASRLPEEAVQEWYRRDESAYRLHKAVEASGIEKYLQAHGKRYCALRPRWRNEQETDFWFWLNPEDQHSNHYGWFTLEELRLWAHDQRPIPKRPIASGRSGRRS